MTENEIIAHIINLEIAIANQQKAVEDLSDMVIKQGKQIDMLTQQNERLKNMLSQDIVKPLSEETPPPHY
jgi:uncharacterized coiled-coil protein SlyX